MTFRTRATRDERRRPLPGDRLVRRPQTTVTHAATIGAPPEDVWGFMVDPAALSAWFGADAWLEPVVNGAVLLRFPDGSLRRGAVEAVERAHRLTWRWREQRGVGYNLQLGEPSRVTIELEPVPAGTRLTSTKLPVRVIAGRRPSSAGPATSGTGDSP